MSTPTDSRFAPGSGSTVPAEAEGNAAAPAAAVADITKEDRQTAITECYTEATKLLRINHRDEFLATQKGLLAARGIDWTPAPTKAERAKAQAVKLLTDAGLPVPAELA